MGNLSVIGVDEKGYLLEGEKGNPQRDENGPERPRLPHGQTHILKEKIAVFEIAQNRQIEDDSHAQKKARGSEGKPLRKEKISPNGTQKKRQIGRIPPAVEEHRKQHRDAHGRRPPGFP